MDEVIKEQTIPREIEIGKEAQFKIRVEDATEFDSSFFKENYKKAIANIEEIITNTKEYYDDINRQDWRSKKFDHFDYKDKEEKNNIIAFCGERGAGKTSVMISVARALKQTNKESLHGKINGCNFWVIDMIDPSTFENEESVFAVILAKLFTEFKDEIEESPQNSRSDEQREIIHQFRKVYDNYKQVMAGADIRAADDLGETLEALSNLAAGSNMRKSFFKLVKRLLEYKFGKNNLGKSFIVFSIDDMDMCFGKAYEMAEQIRKYLVIPNVISLLAIKIEQLNNSIEQKFILENKILIEYEAHINNKKKLQQDRVNRIDNRLEEDPKIMATRYIEKLIPNGKKIYLSRFSELENISYTRLACKKDMEYKEDSDFMPISPKEPKEKHHLLLQQQILRLIYRKTGLIFLSNKNEVHMFVPDNMRDLQNFVALMLKLPDVNIYVNSDENLENIKNNMAVFENYFKNTWIKQHLPNEDIDRLKEYSRCSNGYKNKYIIQMLLEKYSEMISNNRIINTNDVEEVQSFIGEIYIKDADKISLGDVIDALNMNDFYIREYELFKFAISTLHSICLFKMIYIYHDNNATYHLIAGSIFGKIEESIIRKKRDEKISRALFIVDEYTNLLIAFKIDGCRNTKKIPCVIQGTISNLVKVLTKGDDSTQYTIEYLDKNNISVMDKDERKIQENLNFERELIEQEIIKSLRFIHYFLMPQNPQISKIYERKYDDNARIGTGGNSTNQAVFCVMAFINRLINPERITEIIFEENLKNSQNRDNDSEYYDAKYNIDHDAELKAWLNTYRVILPIYSLDVIIDICKKMKDEKSRYYDLKEAPNENEGEYYSHILHLIKRIKKYLNDTFNEQIYCDSKIKEAFDKCPIIKAFDQSIDSKGNIYVKNEFEKLWQMRRLPNLFGKIASRIYDFSLSDPIDSSKIQVVNNSSNEGYNIALHNVKDLLDEIEGIRLSRSIKSAIMTLDKFFNNIKVINPKSEMSTEYKDSFRVNYFECLNEKEQGQKLNEETKQKIKDLARRAYKESIVEEQESDD